MSVHLDCRKCGACCSTWEVFVQIDEVFKHPTVKVRRWDALPHDKGTKRCGYLDGRVGACVSCTIYEDRPETCRGFAVGSSQCLDARKKHGLAEAA